MEPSKAKSHARLAWVGRFDCLPGNNPVSSVVLAEQPKTLHPCHCSESEQLHGLRLSGGRLCGKWPGGGGEALLSGIAGNRSKFSSGSEWFGQGLLLAGPYGR